MKLVRYYLSSYVIKLFKLKQLKISNNINVSLKYNKSLKNKIMGRSLFAISEAS